MRPTSSLDLQTIQSRYSNCSVITYNNIAYNLTDNKNMPGDVLRIVDFPELITHMQ